MRLTTIHMTSVKATASPTVAATEPNEPRFQGVDLGERRNRAADGGIQIGMRPSPVRPQETVDAVVRNRERVDLDATERTAELLHGRENRTIDLGDLTLLPGLTDAHTHNLLQPEDEVTPPVLTKSQAYRAIESVSAAKKNLEAGFTTVRNVAAAPA